MIVQVQHTGNSDKGSMQGHRDSAAHSSAASGLAVVYRLQHIRSKDETRDCEGLCWTFMYMRLLPDDWYITH
jgi:hypothetical protein